MNYPDKKTSGSSAACMYRWDQIYNLIKPAYSRKIRCHWSENKHLMLQLQNLYMVNTIKLMIWFSCHVMFGGDAIEGCPDHLPQPLLNHQKGDWAAAQSAATLATYSTRWWFHVFYFHPYLGKWSKLTDIFQMGWNHQVVNGGWLFLRRFSHAEFHKNRRV